MLEYAPIANDPRMIAAAVAAACVIGGLVAHAILFAGLTRIAAFSAMASEIVRQVRAPARLLLPLLGLHVAATLVGDVFEFGVATSAASALLTIAALTWLAVRAIAGVAVGVAARHPLDVGDNLDARRILTQTRVLARVATALVLVVGVASALMVFPGVRQIGASILASAGLAGVVAAFAARSVLGNLIAGLQIALTQPIRLDDVVIIDGQWGRIEEIAAAFVVVRIWDERRLVIPLQWLIEHPFENWTRREARLLGTVELWVDYALPMAPLREEVSRVCRAAPEWDGRVAQVDVVDAGERAMKVRALVSAADSSKAWDLRCRVREALVTFVQRQYPAALPRLRVGWDDARVPPIWGPEILTHDTGIR